MKEFQFSSKRFLIRPLRVSDYMQWRKAHESMFLKQNSFDQDKKKPSELTKKEFLSFLKKNKKFWSQDVIYYFGIFEKKTGRLMGHILFALIARFNVQSTRISYAIFNNYWKHGYGKEAVSAAVNAGFKKMKLHRIEAEILPANRASIALAKSLEFQYEGIRRGAVYFQRKWHDHAVYAILAEDRGVKKTAPSIL